MILPDGQRGLRVRRARARLCVRSRLSAGGSGARSAGVFWELQPRPGWPAPVWWRRPGVGGRLGRRTGRDLLHGGARLGGARGPAPSFSDPSCPAPARGSSCTVPPTAATPLPAPCPSLAGTSEALLPWVSQPCPLWPVSGGPCSPCPCGSKPRKPDPPSSEVSHPKKGLTEPQAECEQDPCLPELPCRICSLCSPNCSACGPCSVSKGVCPSRLCVPCHLVVSLGFDLPVSPSFRDCETPRATGVIYTRGPKCVHVCALQVTPFCGEGHQVPDPRFWRQASPRLGSAFRVRLVSRCRQPRLLSRSPAGRLHPPPPHPPARGRWGLSLHHLLPTAPSPRCLSPQ